MSSFIEGCNCRGLRPKGVVGHKHYSRPSLIATLLGDRKVARFIVAPNGFGKSNIAFEYAQIIFDFKHVFWIRGGSPCFLRDLDSSDILMQILDADKDATLVIFDDIPFLDADRARSFSALIDDLLERNIEVIATCIPSLDSFMTTQRDRISITGNDLLLNEEELSFEVLNGRMQESVARELAIPDRIPSLIWGEDDTSEQRILSGLIVEHLPGDVMLTMCIMLFLIKGTMEDLAIFLSKDHISESVEYISMRYPYLGVDLRAKTFFTRRCSIEGLSAAFNKRMDELSSHSSQDDKESFYINIADVLLEHGESKRACDFLIHFASKHTGAYWLSSRGFRLVSSAECVAVMDLFDFAKRESNQHIDSRVLIRAFASYQLGDEAVSVSSLRRVMRSSTAAEVEKLLSASLIMRIGSKGDKSKAEAYILNQRRDALSFTEGNKGGSVYIPVEAGILARFSYLGSDGISTTLDEWVSLYHQFKDASQGDDRLLSTLLMSSLWLVRDLLSEYSVEPIDLHGGEPIGLGGLHCGSEADAKKLPNEDSIRNIAVMVCDCIDKRVASGNIDWFAYCAYEALESLASGFKAIKFPKLSSSSQSVCKRVRVHLAKQQKEYQKKLVHISEKKRSYQQMHPDVFRRDNCDALEYDKPSQTVPILSVDLFGGMEVRIGEEIVDPHLLSRMKTKTLLALLTINRGREISRDILVDELWPDSGADVRRRNFYSVWSQLRRALTIGESCPYLIRSKTGCKLDTRYIKSDIQDFEALCRTMIFGDSDSCDWEELYRKVCDNYSEELMPCETENGKILMLREHYHMQLVDGLIAMSRKLCSCGEVSGSLWFAREAIRRDDKREDAYIALMESQIEANQRSSALKTYFSCRRFLNEELGIDPSSKLVQLYRSIIESEEEL